jgi:prepilin-type N-terminal cleavage/methylation domain-containing protein
MKKKGFTLIELLAVILILGIIALIAIPTVNNILKEARRGAFQSTLENLVKAIEEKCTTEQIKNQEITTMYVIENGVISPSLDIKGNLPDGIFYVTKLCEVEFDVYDNNFMASKTIDGEIIISDKKNNNGEYTDVILNGADPVLSDDLIPVTITNDGKVYKADTKTKWYSYREKKWANAVVLSDEGKVENDGLIKEESIAAYFVWIPRYKYKLFDMGNYTSATNISEKIEVNKARTIEIVFETKDEPVSIGTQVGEYHSHPAFIEFDVNGFWMAKFQTSGSKESPKSKPNQQPLVNIDIKGFFESAYNFRRNSDSHMLKNTEWGAVAYLTYSKYGLNGEVAFNGENKTGYGKDYVNNVYKPYNTEKGSKASTTGNITGVYDMSGLKEEYVAAYREGFLSNSGFTEEIINSYDSKYFNVYPGDSGSNSYNYRILGDATGELGPFYLYESYYRNSWNFNDSRFVDFNGGWFYRGGRNAVENLSGIFSFHRDNGNGHPYDTFRMSLAIK